jgi:LysM repeat protein
VKTLFGIGFKEAEQVARAKLESAYDNLSAERRAEVGLAAYQSPKQLAKAAPELKEAFNAGDFERAAKRMEKIGEDLKDPRYRGSAEIIRDPSLKDKTMVKSGDKLGKIADRLDYSVEQLMEANPHIEDEDFIRAGDILNLPKTETNAPKDQTRPIDPDEKSKDGSANIKGGTGEDQLEGSSADDALSPEHKQVAEDLTKQDNPLEEILDKDPADLTEGELRQVMLARKSAKTDTEREKLFGVEKAFYDGVYGTGNAKYDVTGKMIDPAPIRPINEKPVPARGKGGKTMVENLNMLAKAVAVPRSGEGAPEVVKALQTGLNILNRIRTDKLAKKQFGSTSPLFSDIKDDGITGPKTRGAFKSAAAKLGPAKIKEGMALGRFKRFANAPKFGELRSKAAGAFGGLFRKPPAASKPKITDEGFGVQATINDLGRDAFGNDFKPIREDGDIGPMTETAFKQVLPAAGADTFTSKLSDNLGFFDDDDDSFFI